MLNIFKIKNHQLLHLKTNTISKNDLKSAIWIDLIEPEENECKYIFEKLGQKLSENHKLDNIEASARFFEDKDGLHIHSFFFYENTDDHAGNGTVVFTINSGKLYTLREREFPAFRLYRMRAKNQILINNNPYELLLDLFETKIEQLADEIENIYSALEKISIVIMQGKKNNEFDNEFSKLAELEDISWKVRLCLMDTQRALNFLIRRARIPNAQLEQARDIIRDIESLLPHNESLFQKVNFLMQAAMGFINIEQNRIIKIFSLVSVVFLPPTLVASSYGMNFNFMPELKWSFGYPAAIVLMIFAGLIPYFYFRRKNWL